MEFYLGEVRAFAFGFDPVGWAECNGELLPISENAALFSLLGTSYGGDGRTSFALPKMQPLEAAGESALGWRICVQGIYPPRQ